MTDRMRAVVVRRGESDPAVIELPRPTPADGEALIRSRRVGIDGTDHEVIGGGHGGFPEGADHLVLGHEAVGRVVDSNGTDLAEGQLVVPTVRRPPAAGSNDYFTRGEPDMAPDGAYVERGIAGAHGFMAEYATSSAEFLVPIPDDPRFADYGFLVEPISNTEKALNHAFASRSAFEWSPESALVLGNGPLGLLTVATLVGDDRFDRIYCLGRRTRPDPTIDIVERLGATYVNSRETPVPEIPDAHEAVDLVYEATGHAPHAFECVDALAPGGVAALLGIPGEHALELDAGWVHRELVLENKALLGSVNSSVPHFEAAVDTMADFPDWFFDALVTGIYGPDEAARALETGDDVIKTVIDLTA